VNTIMLPRNGRRVLRAGDIVSFGGPTTVRASFTRVLALERCLGNGRPLRCARRPWLARAAFARRLTASPARRAGAA
jgi:hypothetical protein